MIRVFWGVFAAIVVLSAPLSSDAQTQDVAESETAADRAYHDAFLRLVKGQRGAAEARLRELVTNYPQHPLAPRARRVLTALDPSWESTPVDVKPPTVAANGEETSGVARAELAIVQTLHGVALGTEVCFMLECEDVRAYTAALLAGGGLGLGLSLGLTADGITPGHSSAINTGTMWGAWQGIALANIVDLDDSRDVAALMGGLQLAGLGTGELVWRWLKPRGGDMSLGTTVGLWSGALGLFAHGIGEFEASSEALWLTLLVASDVGLVAGALLTSYEPMSRGRTLVINAGGIVGTLLGLGLPAMIQGEDVDGQVLFVGATIGAISGLGASYFFTRNWDVDMAGIEVTPTLALSHEGEPQFGLVGRF